MRVVLDTNVLVAGLLWFGPPHRILELADEGAVTLCLTEVLLEELADVLPRPKFRSVIARRQTSVDELMVSVFAAARLFQPTMLNGLPDLRDPDDSLVLECAVSANADYIILGDDDLLVLERFHNIQILSPAEFIRIVEKK